jgi:peroxiredoxin
LVQLQKKLSEFEERDVQLVALSYDNVKTLAAFADAKKIKFPLLSDQGSKQIKALGLEYKRGLPYPGTIFIGTDGKVKGKMFEEDFKVRPSVNDLIEKVDSTIAENATAGVGG